MASTIERGKSEGEGTGARASNQYEEKDEMNKMVKIKKMINEDAENIYMYGRNLKGLHIY